ncbi:MAG: DNA primase [Candidatus Firestonebacteria bacterium RIFOXYC2_FULL_39_67]|nr:MAG: DNA primase [Candidatus Firestonebacteria bacterium RIFOXYD2_FULL_39_29]OGF54906.1 MAG: DNA primase [Candidatus Firestonebacteria bacterium RIFOXYC2_FULL_39_67]OGF57747.1 MAG: DNA primase [Candidatus Firestonebacteria bacterium RifOxyC12_full_39_7]
MGLIPQDKILHIKEAFDIVDVISEHVHLKKSGQNFKGLCPFHNEKTSSFVVSPVKQIYHCFGCGEGGNVLHFISKIENISFIEAVKYLAEKKGITLDTGDTAKKDEYEELFKVNELAVKYFRQKLKESKTAQDYLSKRNLNPETLEKFAIGFVPEEWDGLLNFGRKNNISPELLEKAGLIIKRDKKDGHYDRFRNRIIFPIVSSFGRYVAFGARVLDNSLPKYINSPETQVYSKGKNLYGWNIAKTNIPEELGVVIVEGYLDCITCHQYGITNTVATLGTSLTKAQALLLKRYTDKVVIAYDLDAAGINASLRGIAVLVEAGLDVKVVVFSGSKDPDEYLNKEGKVAFVEKLRSAKSIVDFWLDIVKPENLADLKGKLKLFSQMLPVVAAVSDDVKREEYRKIISARMNLPERLIREQIESYYEKLYNVTVDKKKETAKKPGVTGRDAKDLRTERMEKQLLVLSLSDIETAKRVKSFVFPSDFDDEAVKKIFELIFGYCEKENGFDYSAMADELEGEARKLFTEVNLDKVEYSEESRIKAEKDLIKAVKNSRLEKRLKEIDVEIKKGNVDKELYNEYMSIQRHFKGSKTEKQQGVK